MLETWHRLLQRLCPESCPRCGIESAEGFCPHCREDFTRIESPCPRCSMPGPCGPCPMSGPEWRLDAVRAPFVYGPPVARYLWALKYRAERHLGRPLGQLLGDAIVRVELDIDAIVGVPLHPRRLRLRTFNQADEIAAPVAARLGRRLLGSGLRRSIQTQPQAELDRKTRLKAPLECFTVDRNLAGLRVAIVDDVITTGATVNALASALKSSGAVHVEAWSVARSIGKATGPGYSIRKI